MLYPTVSRDRDGAPGRELRVAVTACRDHLARRPTTSAICAKSYSVDLASAVGRAGRARWKSCAGTRAAPSRRSSPTVAWLSG